MAGGEAACADACAVEVKSESLIPDREQVDRAVERARVKLHELGLEDFERESRIAAALYVSSYGNRRTG